MVKTGFHNGSYVILSIAGEHEEHCTYLVRDRSGKQYIACELKSLALINRWLPEINKAAQDGRIVCFTENACLYIITSYTDGENARLAFAVQHTELRRRLELLRDMTFRLVECSDMPELILKGLLTFELYSELFSGCFTPADVKRLKYLSIVLQKLSNGIYNSFMEIYLDIGQLLEKLEQSGSFLTRLKELHQRVGGVVRIVVSAAVLVAAAVVVYNMITRSAQQSSEAANTPIDHIGTVLLDNESTVIRDIHVK